MVCVLLVKFVTQWFHVGFVLRYLNIDSARLDHIRKQGFTCGSTLDVIDDLPVGSIRVSFGYMSALRDADALVYVQSSIATAYVCVIDLCAHVCVCVLCGIRLCVYGRHTAYLLYLLWAAKLRTDAHASVLIDVTCFTACRVFVKDKFVEVATPSIDLLRLAAEAVPSCETPISGTQSGTDGHTPCLTKIRVFPVKSCGGFEVEEWEITPQGLQYDRMWMVLNAYDACVTQKQVPKLCLVAPTLDRHTGVLTLHAPGMPSIVVSNTFAPPAADDAAGTLSLEWCGGFFAGYQSCFYADPIGFHMYNWLA